MHVIEPQSKTIPAILSCATLRVVLMPVMEPRFTGEKPFKSTALVVMHVNLQNSTMQSPSSAEESLVVIVIMLKALARTASTTSSAYRPVVKTHALRVE